MKLSNRTRILAALVVLVVFMQLFPDRAGTIELAWMVVAGLCAAIWGTRRFLLQRQQRQAAAALARADDDRYRLYKTELDDIRSRHDPERDLSDPTSIAPEYQSELNRLHHRYQDMLERKFGKR